MLSPTLPAWVDQDMFLQLPKRMLSPGLPDYFSKTPATNESVFLVTLKLNNKRASANPPRARATNMKRRIDRDYSVSDTEPSSSSHDNKPAVEVKEEPNQPIDTDTKAPGKERNKEYKAMRNTVSKWMSLAKSKKYESDNLTRSGQTKLACAVALDSLLCFIVGFDYEDRLCAIAKAPLKSSSWDTLIPFVNHLIKIHMDAEFLHLVGLCHLIRALVHLRIASCACDSIQRLLRTPHVSIEDVAQTVSSYQRTNHHATKDFKLGMKFLSLSDIHKSFPRTWAARQPMVQPLNFNPDGFRPSTDPYYLPIHCFSSLQEGAAFGFSVIHEWADSLGLQVSWALDT